MPCLSKKVLFYNGHQQPRDYTTRTARTHSSTGANVNLRNDDGNISCPQHGVVKSLGEALEMLRTGQAPDHVVCDRLKSLLKVLDFLLLSGLDVAALNARNRTALDDFLVLKPALASSNVTVIVQIASVFESALTPGSTQIPPPAAAFVYTAPVSPRTVGGIHDSYSMHPIPHQARAPAAAVHKSWFCKVFGFEETDGGQMGTFAFVRGQLTISQTTLGAYIFTTPHGKQFWAGRFTQESLGHLQGKLQVSFSSRCHSPSHR